MKLTMFTSALVSASFVAGSAQADVVYSSEDWEGEAVGEVPTTPNGTDYINTSDATARAQVAANVAGGPTGQHGLIQGNVDKHVTLTNPMTLASDGIESIEVDFAILFDKGIYSLTQNEFELVYSASGDFDDTESIQLFTTVDSGADEPYEYDQATWYTGESVTISDADVTFTDTAKLRWRKGPDSNGFNSSVYIDDVTITGVVPEPTSLALLGLGGLLIARRRRG